jgi:hypothetical protein
VAYVLEVQVKHVIHNGWFAEVGTWDELGLLCSLGGGGDECIISEFGPDVTGFSVLQNIDDKADVSVSSVTGLARSAVGSGKAYESWWRNRGSLSAQ